MSWPCACGHAAGDHDRQADRYCAATRANDLVRTCICVPAPTTPRDRLAGHYQL